MVVEPPPPSKNPPLLSTIASSLVAGEGAGWRRFVALKASSEYDSEEALLTNTLSARILNGLAKIKASFQRSQSGEIRAPSLSLSTKHLSVLYDHEDRNALVTAIAKLGSNFEMKYLRDIKVRPSRTILFQFAGCHISNEILEFIESRHAIDRMYP
jgi:hypothetical protein